MGEGGLPREQVLAVLKAAGVDAYPQEEDPAKTVLTKGDETLVFTFKETISRHMISKLARKFDVPIHLIYNPQAARPR